MKHLLYILLLLIAASMLPSCIEDGVITDASAQPRFSADTLSLGTVFTGEGSPTAKVKVYNPHDRILNISSVRLRSGNYFRINVDGFSGREFADVEIRPRDSIFILVETTLPSNGGDPLPILIDDHIDLLTNGVVSTIVVEAMGQDVDLRRAETLYGDTRFTAGLPYRIMDSLVVAPDVTLTIEPGVTLYFHDGAQLRVHGTLRCEGTPEAPVTMRGDRQGVMAGKITYEIMANQWDGITFYPESTGNSLTYTIVENMATGVTLTGTDLTLRGCRVHNSGGNLITSTDSRLTALATQLTNASASVLEISGGETRLGRCTVANYYLFAIPRGFLMDIADDTGEENEAVVDVTNSILAGRGGMLSSKGYEGRPVRFARCMMLPDGSDDENFINCLWGTDPLLDFDLVNYTFDYSPLADSPAIGAADPELDMPDMPEVDAHGRPLGLTIGAYAPADSQ